MSGKEYFSRYRKDDKGKYIRNVSPASMNQSITETTSDKYKKLNKKIDRSRQNVKKMDYQRKQNFNPFA